MKKTKNFASRELLEIATFDKLQRANPAALPVHKHLAQFKKSKMVIEVGHLERYVGVDGADVIEIFTWWQFQGKGTFFKETNSTKPHFKWTERDERGNSNSALYCYSLVERYI